MNDFLPRAVMLRLLAVLAIVLAPHWPRLPLWEELLVPGILLWRLAATLRQWRPLPRWAKVLVTFGAFGAVFVYFQGNISGQIPGVALLTVMSCLKLTEMSRRRDVMVMVLLQYFILITHFLFSQEIWTIAYLLFCAVLITGLLVEANHPDGALPLRTSLRQGGRLILHSLPLMAVLFVLFPRIPGPLWGLPTDAGASRSGLGEEMTPDAIQKLIESDAPAFRVSFDGPVPAPEEMYWRGPVLWAFDGRSWKSGTRPAAVTMPSTEVDGPEYRYEMTMEPQRRPWLLALDLPERGSLPSDASLNMDYTAVARDDIKERRLYKLVSHPRSHLQQELPPNLRQELLALPLGRNPRTLTLARQWRAQGLDDAGIVKAALNMFRSKEFYYTLEPPPLGADGIDDFLFNTRRGFCEHYSSSFTVLMRAAGIPARVVTGYQGGALNQYGDYYLVRQSDAHAWSEVWMEGRGWVRVDPTAAVAPQRIERSLGTALEGGGELDARRHSFHLGALLEARWDWANEVWNRWVLGYGPDLQQAVLARLGLVEWSDMILALTVAIVVVLGLLSLSLARQFLPQREPDPVLQQWRKLRKRLARAGFEQRAGEGPQDFARRVIAGRPDLASAMDQICALYLRLRYLEQPDAGAQKEFSEAVAALRTR
jgi:transglutaminase-like putative cysteine protease